MVTKAAITTTYAGIRTLSGIKSLMAAIATLEHISTNMVDSPIPIPLMAEVVVPNVGHMPNRRTKVGFSVIIPLSMIFNLFMAFSLFRFTR